MADVAGEIEAWLGEPLELRRVVPVASEVRNGDGGRTVVSSIELWNTMMIVRWTVIAPEHLRHPMGQGPPQLWRCEDDQGTNYRLIGGGGGGGERYWSGAAEFQPPPPPEARQIVLFPECAPTGRIEIPLT